MTYVPPGYSLIENDTTHVRRIWPTNALGLITDWTVVTSSGQAPTGAPSSGHAEVTSVAGRTGNVVLSMADIADWAPVIAAEAVSFAGTGIAATNVRDAILEVLGYTDDAGDYWSSTTKTLDVNAGVYKVDGDLNVPILANQWMQLDYHLRFSGPTAATANLRSQIVAPAGATADWGSALDWNAAGSAGTPKQNLAAITDTRTFSLNTGVTGIHITAVVTNGASDGVVSLQLAPDTTTASPVVRNPRARVEYSKAM